jgi:hypothetical protein
MDEAVAKILPLRSSSEEKIRASLIRTIWRSQLLAKFLDENVRLLPTIMRFGFDWKST